MTRQKGIFEGENLKLHLCNGVFEAYSASYLTTKEHMIHVNSETFNLTWVNCEMASFIHMKEGRNFFSNPFAHGMVIQVHAPSLTHPIDTQIAHTCTLLNILQTPPLPPVLSVTGCVGSLGDSLVMVRTIQ